MQPQVTTGWSTMYEFSTSQALGLSAMAVAANPDTRELLGVFAIDYDVGAISSVISSTLSGAVSGHDIAAIWVAFFSGCC